MGTAPRAAAALASICLLAASVPARAERLDVRRVTLDLPGPPAAVVPADLDADGRVDLAVVAAWSEIEEVGGVRVEDLVQVATVIPALFERREVRAYLAQDDGSYAHAATLPLPRSVLHLEAAGPLGAVALTDAGLSRLRYAGGALSLEPLIEAPPLLAGTETFYSALSIVHDLDGDGRPDVWFPAADGPQVRLGVDGPAGPALGPPRPVAAPGGETTPLLSRQRLPEVVQVDGDGVPDLVFREADRVDVLLGNGDGTFRPLRAEPRDCHDRGTDLRWAGVPADRSPWPTDVAALRDVDGDGRAELVVSVELPRGDGLRQSLKDAKRPIRRYRFHDLDASLDAVADPYFEAELVGHAAESDGDEFPHPLLQFDDLDGDGREELITMTLDFSMFAAVKILVTKRIGVGTEFHVHRQGADGTFAKIPGLDLTEKLKLDLNRVRIGSFGQFAGDFDGDGRKDFVHLGRGAKVTVHRGAPGPTWPADPDLTIDLGEEPESLDLVRIEDLDGDGRSDLRVTRPGEATDPDLTAPVRLDLFLGGGAR